MGISKISVFLVSGLAVMTLLPSCATRGYARRQARDVDAKVTALAATVQENSERLDATDARARQGIADASAARSAAAAAQATANQANSTAGASQSAAASAQSAADSAYQNAQSANAKLSSMDGRVTQVQEGVDKYNVGPVTLVMFKVGKSELTNDAKRALDDVVGPLTALDAGYRVEIQGFTSSEGAEAMNLNLSQDRSEAVQRYLVSKGAWATRIAIVGLGADRPIGDNKTKSGREQNRRAEIRIFTAAK